MAKNLPKPQRLLTETEWRELGVQQSRGWVNYMGAHMRTSPIRTIGALAHTHPHNWHVCG